MTTANLVPVRQVKQLRLLPPGAERQIEGIDWLPVSTSELHLASRYFPVAVRIGPSGARLGLLVGQRYLRNPLVDQSGKWRGAYRPIAARCFPFSAPRLSDDPLSDLMIDASSEFLSHTGGIPLINQAGSPSSMLVDLHRLFQVLRASEDALAAVLDSLFVADWLVPVQPPEEGQPQLMIVDPARFAEASNRTLGAMARSDFRAVDTTIAGLFSLQNLHPDYLTKQASLARCRTFVPNSPAQDPLLLDDLPLALDDGELVPLDAIRTDSAFFMHHPS